MGEIQKYLQNIEDFVMVEDKIVTYKFICKALKIHVNKAKELLREFAILPDNSSKIVTTYLIGGEKEDGRFKFVLVDSNEVENVKKKFEKISSEHVYCVQKSTTLSSTDLYNADSAYEMMSEDKKFSSICNDDIKIRDVPKCMPVKKEEPKKIENKKVEPLKPVQDVQEEIKTDKKSPVKPKKNQKKNTPVQNSLSTLFNRQAALPKKEKKEAKENITALPKKDDKKEAKENIKTDEKIESPKKKKIEIKKKRKKNTDNNKTRKRIKIASDSESDEMDFEEAPQIIEEEEIAKPVESDDDIIPATPVAKGRKRVRKQVDNTFVDDDGFMITKKEYVYESSSDTEESVVPPKIDKPDKKEDKTEKCEKTEKFEKTEKVDKTEKVVEKTEKVGKTEKVAKIDKTEKVVEKTKKSPKDEKPKKQTKTKKSPQKNQPSIMKFFQKK